MDVDVAATVSGLPANAVDWVIVQLRTGTGAIDFTTSSLSALGVNPMSVLADGRYGLISGEASTSGTIQTGDFVLWSAANAVVASGYLLEDFDLDYTVTVSDFVLWSKNNAAVAASGVPEE